MKIELIARQYDLSEASRLLGYANGLGKLTQTGELNMIRLCSRTVRSISFLPWKNAISTSLFLI